MSYMLGRDDDIGTRQAAGIGGISFSGVNIIECPSSGENNIVSLPCITLQF